MAWVHFARGADRSPRRRELLSGRAAAPIAGSNPLGTAAHETSCLCRSSARRGPPSSGYTLGEPGETVFAGRRHGARSRGSQRSGRRLRPPPRPAADLCTQHRALTPGRIPRAPPCRHYHSARGDCSEGYLYPAGRQSPVTTPDASRPHTHHGRATPSQRRSPQLTSQYSYVTLRAGASDSPPRSVSAAYITSMTVVLAFSHDKRPPGHDRSLGIFTVYTYYIA